MRQDIGEHRFSIFLGFCLICYVPLSWSGNVSEEGFAVMRKEMVDNQIRSRGIHDEKILEVLQNVSRHKFVPSELRKSAYSDEPLPIGYGQTISQPYIVAFMTEALKIKSTDRILEVGTGSGYQAAVLSKLGSEVYTMEIVEPLYREVTERLQRLGYHNIYTRHGDGWKGWPEKAPFDKIIITAAADEVPEALVEQLVDEGMMIVPIGGQFETQYLVIGVKKGELFETTETIPVRFVPLIRGHSESQEKS